MAYQILKHPDPRLHEVAEPMAPEEINDDFRATLDELFTLMHESRGGGLAAVQVGIKKRFFIMEDPEGNRGRFVIVNPEIVATEGQVLDEEGCLSFPGVFVKVKRARWVRVQGLDAHGQPFELESEGYLGRCIQHEIDHLNGITFFDRLSGLKRQMAEKKYKKLQTAAA